jgi:streptogramin lyase
MISFTFNLSFMKKLSFLVLLLIGFALQANSQSCTSLLAQNQIKGIVKAGSCLWSATNGGLVKYDTATYQKTYFTKDNSNLPQNALTQIAADASGNLWMTTDAGLVIKFDGSVFTTFDLLALFSITDSYYPGSMIVQGNKVYIGWGSKMLCYNGVSWAVFDISYTGEHTILSIGSLQYYQNELYIGLDVYDNNSDFFIHLVKFDGTTFTLLKELGDAFADNIQQADQFTSKFTIDNQGDFWLSMYEGGISKMDHTTLVITRFTIPWNVRNCPQIYITVIFLFNDNLYMGTLGKAGMLTFNITTSTWNSITDGNSLMPRSDILSIVSISANTFYIGNEIGLVRVSILDKQCTLHNINHNENKFDFTFGYSYNIVGDYLYLSGEQYFGGNDSLRVYNIETSNWSTWKDYGGFASQAHKFVSDNAGKLWICSYWGIFYLEGSTNTWTQYTAGSADTLRNVTNMLFDKNNNMWLYSNEDLLKINPTGVIQKIYHSTTGGGFNDLCYDKNNFVYAAAGASTTEGFVKVNIVTDAITYYQNDNYNHPLQYVNLYFANDTLYFHDYDVMGKIHNGQLIRKFELSDYEQSYTQRTPTQLLRSFCVDKAGKIWFLDQSLNKVFVYDASTGFTTYDYSNSCISNDLYSIKCDEKNRKWIQGDGLYRIEDNNMSTGINDGATNTSQAEVFIYPNPLSGQAHVQLPESSAPVRSIAVMDMKSSETVAIDNYSMSGDQIELNLSFLKQGMYILRVTTEDDKERNLKFVKMQ